VPVALVILPLPQDRITDVSSGFDQQCVDRKDAIGWQGWHQFGNQAEKLMVERVELGDKALLSSTLAKILHEGPLGTALNC